MSYQLAVIFTFSIAIAAIIGWIRFKVINPAYYPFLYCIWIGLLNEIIGYVFARSGLSNAINNNIYVLAEAILFTWQFKNWGLFRRVKKLFIVLLGSYVIFWFIESILLGRIIYTTSYFRVFYSFIIVLMSINIINEQLVSEKRNFLKSPIFLICLGFVIYYTYKVLVGVFWLYGLGGSRQFRINLIWILIYINLLTNLIYALAVLWMPRRHRFSLPS